MLGEVTGEFAGESGPDATVVAATIPAILSLAGGGVAWFAVRSHDMAGAVCAFVFIVAFCNYFKESVEHGVIERRAYAAWSTETAERKKIEKRELELEACTRMEIKINQAREIAGLALLPPEYFCEVPP